jgi:hypothetical protein
MVVVLTYWLSYEYVRDPRRALEPEHAQLALMRGAHHVLNLSDALPGAGPAPAPDDPGDGLRLQRFLNGTRRRIMLSWTPFPFTGAYVYDTGLRRAALEAVARGRRGADAG